MKNRVKFVGLVLLVCLLLSACACEHEWKEADCAEPRTCVRCKETQGEPLGHFWVDATCAAPLTCRDCGMTRGEALPHMWAEATCIAAKTCQVCGGTEGEPLGHIPGEWEVSLRVQTLVQTRVKHCTVCQEQVEEETATLSVLHEDGKFLLSCVEIHSRMLYLIESTEIGYVKYDPVVIFSVDSDKNAAAYLKVVDGSYSYAILRYSDGTALIPYKNYVNATCREIILDCDQSELGKLACMVMPAVVDPTLTLEASEELIDQTLNSPEGTVECNGIRYTIEKKGGIIHLTIQLS